MIQINGNIIAEEIQIGEKLNELVRVQLKSSRHWVLTL
jgi:hypothetical protein